MKKTFLYRAATVALIILHVLGASAFLLTVMALCGVPMTWWIGVCSVLPGCLIIQGLFSICNHERNKMVKAVSDKIESELGWLLNKMESDEQEEECRFREGGKCTFGDGLPKCAKENGVTPIMNEVGSVRCKIVISCEDSSVHYLDFEGGLRLIFREGNYVGWYVCGD